MLPCMFAPNERETETERQRERRERKGPKIQFRPKFSIKYVVKVTGSKVQHRLCSGGYNVLYILNNNTSILVAARW